MRWAGGGLLVAIALCGAGVFAAQDQPSCSWAVFGASTANSVLNDVAVIDSSSAWAVGYRRGDGRELTLVRRWDGTSWETQASLDSRGFANRLADVAVAPDGTVWTVGEKGGNNLKPMVQRYDGESWRMEASENPGKGANRFQGVDVAPDGTVYAVGTRQEPGGPLEPMIQRRRRGDWELMTPPRGKELNDVAAIARGDVWAVGQRVTRSGSVRAQIVHYDGRDWTQVTVPALAKAVGRLHGISATSPSDVWAAGLYETPSGATEPLMLHFDGTSWSRVELPPLEEDWLVLVDVAAVDDDAAAAVGHGYSTQTERHTQAVLEWDGETWRRTHPDEERGQVELNGVDLSADGGGWAVGWAAGERFGEPASYVERRTCA